MKFFVLAVFTLTACASDRDRSHDAIPTLRPCELYDKIAMFDGKVVKVVGSPIMDFEHGNNFLERDCRVDRLLLLVDERSSRKAWQYFNPDVRIKFDYRKITSLVGVVNASGGRAELVVMDVATD